MDTLFSFTSAAAALLHLHFDHHIMPFIQISRRCPQIMMLIAEYKSEVEEEEEDGNDRGMKPFSASDEELYSQSVLIWLAKNGMEDEGNALQE